MAKDYTGIMILGGAAAAGYILYSNGTLQKWFPTLFGTASGGTYKGVTLLPATILTVSAQQSMIDSALAQGFSVNQTQNLLNQVQQSYQQCGSTAGSPAGTPQTPDSQYGVWDSTKGCVVNLPTVPSYTPNNGTTTGTTTTQQTASPVTVLSVDDAATFPYSAAVTAAQMNGIQTQVDTNLQSGQIPVIAGDSVLAFMLGWGGQPAGTSETALGESYTFDGTNWNLQGKVTDPCSGVPANLMSPVSALVAQGIDPTALGTALGVPADCLSLQKQAAAGILQAKKLVGFAGLGRAINRVPSGLIHMRGF